jgi:hypothetical protein
MLPASDFQLPGDNGWVFVDIDVAVCFLVHPTLFNRLSSAAQSIECTVLLLF